MRAGLLLLLLGTGACAVSDDPAAGGFASGVTGLAGGGYQVRIDERQAALAASEARGEALTAELAALEREHADLQGLIAAQRAELAARGVRVPPETEARVRKALADEPSQPDPARRAAALERAIADARQLAEQLEALAG